MNSIEILDKARLTQLRFASISAHRPKVAMSGGSLMMRAVATLSIHKDDPKKATAKLKVEIRGVPKDAPEDTDQPEFKVDLELRGIYKWPEAVTQEQIEVSEINGILTQPLFLRATSAAESLLSDLGIRGLKLDTDIRAEGQIEADNPPVQPPRSVAAKVKKTTRKKVADT